MFLLPTRKPRGFESDLLYYLGRNFFPLAIPTDCRAVGELDTIFLVSGAICNAPRTDMFEFVRSVSLVNSSEARIVAQKAHC